MPGGTGSQRHCSLEDARALCAVEGGASVTRHDSSMPALPPTVGPTHSRHAATLPAWHAGAAGLGTRLALAALTSAEALKVAVEPLLSNGGDSGCCSEVP